MKHDELQDVENLIQRGYDEDYICEKHFLFCKDIEKRKILVHKVFDNYFKKHLNDEKEIVFYKSEIDFLSGIESQFSKKLFYSLFVARKTHYHHSGWIKFDINEIRQILGEEEITLEDFSDLTVYGFDLRVAGSNDPIITFMDPDIIVYGCSDEFYDAYEEPVISFRRKDSPYKILEVCYAAD